MYCVNGKQIKEEDELMIECDMNTVENVDLGPHIEILRVVKSPVVGVDVLPTALPPPSIIFTSSQIRSLNESSTEQMTAQLQPQQRVQVIKDGRNYDKSPTTIVIQQQHSTCNYETDVKPSASSTITSLPTIMHSNVDSPKKDSDSRSVILNITTNGTSVTATKVNRDSSSASSNSCGSIIFRTPVVSSTSAPMRPPPPPPPPRVKCSSNEEPSSSIPDLGEYKIIEFHCF